MRTLKQLAEALVGLAIIIALLAMFLAATDDQFSAEAEWTQNEYSKQGDNQ